MMPTYVYETVYEPSLSPDSKVEDFIDFNVSGFQYSGSVYNVDTKSQLLNGTEYRSTGDTILVNKITMDKYLYGVKALAGAIGFGLNSEFLNGFQDSD